MALPLSLILIETFYQQCPPLHPSPLLPSPLPLGKEIGINQDEINHGPWSSNGERLCLLGCIPIQWCGATRGSSLEKILPAAQQSGRRGWDVPIAGPEMSPVSPAAEAPVPAGREPELACSSFSSQILFLFTFIWLSDS